MSVTSDEQLKKNVRDALYNVQFSQSNHAFYLKKLKRYYEKADLDAFWTHFLPWFKIPLTIPQNHPCVINTFKFIAKFVISCLPASMDDSIVPVSPIMTKMFEFLLTHRSAVNVTVRYRICYFINLLFESMGNDAFIDDNLCDKVTNGMMDCLMDRSTKVRAQAVFALHRLQDPSDNDCPIIKMYIFHLCNDPSPKVRQAVLATMAKNTKTLSVVIRRTRDVDDTVRKMTYEYLSKVTVRSLSIAQRNKLLKDGLRDRSETVRECVETVLVPAWLRFLRGNYISLLEALDAEYDIEASSLALKALFRQVEVEALIEQVPIDTESKLIPFDKLSSEKILYWCHVAKHLQKESPDEHMDDILPELSKFCMYIRQFLQSVSTKECTIPDKHTQQFIVLQLFEIATVYDLADEVGRKQLHELILDTLKMEHCTEKITECIVKHMEKVVPNTDRRLNDLNGVISEIRMPTTVHVEPLSEEQQHEIAMEQARLTVQLLTLQDDEYEATRAKDYAKAERVKNDIDLLKIKIQSMNSELQPVCDTMTVEKTDAETMIKCLTIMCTMMVCKSVTSLRPVLKELLNMALSNLEHESDSVHILTLKAVSICCLLDKALAKDHIMMLFLQLSIDYENQGIWIMALTGIFDLLLMYGFEYFDIPIDNDFVEGGSRKDISEQTYVEPNRECSNDSTNNSGKFITEKANFSFIQILMELLDNSNQELRNVTTNGLCKLLLNKRISSSKLLQRLTILAYDPKTAKDFYVRQCLSSFFSQYILEIPDSREKLEGIFLPVLQTLCDAPESSSLCEIDSYEVAKWILDLTRGEISKSGKVQSCNVHNNLAFTILAEILNPNSKIDLKFLVNCLNHLAIDINDNSSRHDLLVAVDKVSKKAKRLKIRIQKQIDDFKRKLIGDISVPTDIEEAAKSRVEAEDSTSEAEESTTEDD